MTTDLSADAVITITREGGVGGTMPGLARPRRIVAAELNEIERELWEKLLDLLPAVAAERGEAGRGDQRFFRVEVEAKGKRVVFEVPEPSVPESLKTWWRERR